MASTSFSNEQMKIVQTEKKPRLKNCVDNYHSEMIHIIRGKIKCTSHSPVHLFYDCNEEFKLFHMVSKILMFLNFFKHF